MIKSLFFMLLVFCTVQTPNVFGQTNDDNFYVNDVYIVLNADTRYVRKLANKTISFDKRSNAKEVECFKDGLIKTGLFENLVTSLEKFGDSDDYNLTIRLNYKLVEPIYRIGKIDLVDFNEIDKAKFNSILVKNKIPEKMLSLKTDFPDFENQITKAIQKSYIQKIPKDEMKKPWVELQLATDGKLDVFVMPSFKGCSEVLE